MTMLEISKIRTDGGTQPREALNPEVVKDYTEAMEAGAKFPPIKLIYDGTDHWLWDGFHRVAAAKAAGNKKIAVEVEQGTQADAQWRSLSANQDHGLRRSNADKQRAIKAALLHKLGTDKSDRQIADHVGVDHKTVAAIREKLALSGEIPQIEKRTVTRNGSTYTQDTSKIGKSQPATGEFPQSKVSDEQIRAAAAVVFAKPVDPHFGGLIQSEQKQAPGRAPDGWYLYDANTKELLDYVFETPEDAYMRNRTLTFRSIPHKLANSFLSEGAKWVPPGTRIAPARNQPTVEDKPATDWAALSTEQAFEIATGGEDEPDTVPAVDAMLENHFAVPAILKATTLRYEPGQAAACFRCRDIHKRTDYVRTDWTLDQTTPPVWKAGCGHRCSDALMQLVQPGVLVAKKYGAIMADPAWSYDKYNEAGVGNGTAATHYDVMALPDIMRLPVGDLAADNCALFLWATMPLLPQAFAVGAAWGFEYKTCAFTWLKLKEKHTGNVIDLTGNNWFMGTGAWTRANSELCLLFTRGRPERLRADVQQIIASPVGEHSVKPAEALVRIEQLVAGPYLEMFARTERMGWDVWGNQVESSITFGGIEGR